MASNMEELGKYIDESLKPIAPRGMYENPPETTYETQARETNGIVQSTVDHLNDYRTQINYAGMLAVRLLNTTFPQLAIESNTKATDIIGESHRRLSGLLQDSNSPVAHSGVDKIGAAHAASKEINGNIESGSQLLAEQLKAKIKEVGDLMAAITVDLIWTPFLDGGGLEIIASGNHGALPVYRSVVQPLEEGIDEIRDYRQNLG